MVLFTATRQFHSVNPLYKGSSALYESHVALLQAHQHSYATLLTSQRPLIVLPYEEILLPTELPATLFSAIQELYYTQNHLSGAPTIVLALSPPFTDMLTCTDTSSLQKTFRDWPIFCVIAVDRLKAIPHYIDFPHTGLVVVAVAHYSTDILTSTKALIVSYTFRFNTFKLSEFVKMISLQCLEQNFKHIVRFRTRFFVEEVYCKVEIRTFVSISYANIDDAVLKSFRPGACTTDSCLHF